MLGMEFGYAPCRKGKKYLWEQFWQITSSKVENDYGNTRYCKNPDGRDGAWCYTEEQMKRFEKCDIPQCRDCEGNLRQVNCRI